MPGFRKGRAPEEVVLDRYAPAVEREWHQKLAQLGVNKVVAISGIRPLHSKTKITFDVKSVSDIGVKLHISFETKPVIPEIDPTQFHPRPVEHGEVTEEQVEEAIQQARFFWAEWKAAEGRPIEEGDYVIVDLDVLQEDGTEQRLFNRVRFEVTPKRMAAWMRELLLGAKQGDTLEGISRPDETPDATEADMQPKKVRISVLEVQQAILPPLDDLFAQKMRVENLEALRTSVRSILSRNLDEAANESLRSQVSEFLLERYPFEIPPSVLQAEVDAWNESAQQKDRAQVEADALRSARLFYYASSIVGKEQIPITPQEVEMESLRARQYIPFSKAEEKQAAERRAFFDLMIKKMQDWVLEKSGSRLYSEKDRESIQTAPS